MARYQRAPTAAQPQTQLLAKAQRRVDRWKKAYWGDVFTIIALSLLILGLAAASIAQASSQNSSGALVGVFAWNIVLVCPYIQRLKQVNLMTVSPPPRLYLAAQPRISSLRKLPYPIGGLCFGYCISWDVLYGSQRLFLS